MSLHDASRETIGLRAPRGRTLFGLSRIEAKVIHYSTGSALGNPDDFRWWRNIQAFHMGPKRRWSDVGYAYGLHMRKARVLEGRGIGVVAAHSPGWNARSVSLCLLGDDGPGQDLLPVARARLVVWSEDVDTALGRRVPVTTHRATQPSGYTECPGDETAEWIEAGMPLVSTDDPEEDPMVIGPNIEGKSKAVMLFQNALLKEASISGRLDGDPLPEFGADGYWGDETARAVRAYQAGAQVPVTGVIDGVTAALLVRYATEAHS